jgi:hypothetical protein
MNGWLYKFLALVKQDSNMVRLVEVDIKESRGGKNKNTTIFRVPGYYVRDRHFIPQYDYIYDSNDQQAVHQVFAL